MWLYEDRYGTQVAGRSLKKLAARMSFDLKKAVKENENYVIYETLDAEDDKWPEMEHQITKLVVIK